MASRHDVLTEVQEKSGRVRKKIGKGEWMGRNRYNWMKYHKKDLDENMRVFHINGDKADDDPGNLVAIQFNRTVYNLTHSTVVWRPKPVTKHGSIRMNAAKKLELAP